MERCAAFSLSVVEVCRVLDHRFHLMAAGSAIVYSGWDAINQGHFEIDRISRSSLGGIVEASKEGFRAGRLPGFSLTLGFLVAILLLDDSIIQR